MLVKIAEDRVQHRDPMRESSMQANSLSDIRQLLSQHLSGYYVIAILDALSEQAPVVWVVEQ